MLALLVWRLLYANAARFAPGVAVVAASSVTLKLPPAVIKKIVFGAEKVAFLSQKRICFSAKSLGPSDVFLT